MQSCLQSLFDMAMSKFSISKIQNYQLTEEMANWLCRPKPIFGKLKLFLNVLIDALEFEIYFFIVF